MARPLRIEFAGALYHVTSRGNAQQDIYIDDEDRSCICWYWGSVVSYLIGQFIHGA